ncbi:MAG: rhomboid family intramembrane serine protease [Gemmatimonadota bacterium]|nr:MAG: rhomboid family intramembrane serine protease [Gemmatimonadota bacterium]
MTRWVSRLVYANVAVYLLTAVQPGVVPALWLVPAAIPYRPWTVVTYMFLHGGLLHLLFNMIGLFFFGPRLEQRLGSRHFLGLYFASGIAGALLSLLSPYARIVGASGAVFGVLLGFARYWPRVQILIWGIVPIEARLLVPIMTALSLFGGFSGRSGGIAHFAHLGGFLGGYLYLKWMEHRSPARRFQKQATAPIRKSAARLGGDIERWEKIRPEDLHPVNREELDRVMEKIRDSGVGSLTADERAFLDRFSPG